MTSITELSTEILLGIFTTLKEDVEGDSYGKQYRVLNTLSLVCKRFNAVANFEIFRKYTLALRPGDRRALYDKERRAQYPKNWKDTVWEPKRFAARLQHFKTVAHCVRFLIIVDYEERDPWTRADEMHRKPHAFPSAVMSAIMEALESATRVVKVKIVANNTGTTYWRTEFPPELWKWMQKQKPNDGLHFYGNFEFSKCIELGPIRDVEELTVSFYDEHTECLLQVRILLLTPFWVSHLLTPLLFPVSSSPMLSILPWPS